MNASPCNVLLVTPFFYPATEWGGPVIWAKTLCDEVAKDPTINLRVLTVDGKGPTSGNLTSAELTTAESERYKIIFCRRLFGSSASFEFLLQLFAEARRSDVIHLSMTYSFPTIPTLLLARLLRRRVVWSPHGGLQATATWKEARRIRLKRIFSRLAGLIAGKNVVLHGCTQWEVDDSIPEVRVDATVVIPNGVDPNVPDQQKTRRDLTTTDLIFLGRLHGKKGIENLLAAMGKLPSKVNLRICGTGEPVYESKLRKLAHDLDLMGRVTFLGHLDGEELEEMFRCSDVLVMPSKSENFGIVVIEALARGIPVVATKRTPWSELVEEDCGLWVESDAEALASAIQRISQMDLKEMGANGRMLVERKYSSAAVAGQFGQLYKDLSSSKQSLGKRGGHL